MARNRKRAKERRRTQPVASRPGDGTLTASEAGPAGAPNPLSHGTPDVELAAAQLAYGRPDPDEEPESPEDERELEELAADAGPGGGAGRRGGGDGAGGDGAEMVPAPSSRPAPRISPTKRLVTFLRGSWAELQRVQWPDRRQVMQATSVVIGFVIVAGVYLGVADWVAGKIITYILK